MRLLSITYTDRRSGAGIAALRLHRALALAGVDTTMGVMTRKPVDDALALGTTLTFAACAIRQVASKWVLRLAGAGEGQTLSLNLFPSGLHRIINRFAPDLLHMHWVGAETIRLEEIERITCPVVVTLHDEWPVLGVRHYSDPPSHTGIGNIEGSRASRRFDRLDKWQQTRKLACWRRKSPYFIAPSEWMASQILAAMPEAESRTMVIPNTVPTQVFTAADRTAARLKLGLPVQGPIIAFGALNGTSDPRKGYTLLQHALGLLADRLAGRASLLVFGGKTDGAETIEGFPCRLFGTTEDEAFLALLYAAADVFVCPSLQENLPNTVAESLACGTPCVAFRIGGLPDMVTHERTGYLADPFDPVDLADGIAWVLGPSHECIRQAARDDAERMFAADVVSQKHVALYRRAISETVNP